MNTIGGSDLFPGRDTLLDTGPLVAALVRVDQWHGRVKGCWSAEAPRCITTEPVVVEATHLVRRHGGTPVTVLEYLLAAAIPVMAPHMILHEQCVSLMHQYRDADMDYADAALVALAGRIGVTRIFTTDLRGFRTWRTTRGAPLEIVPLR